MMQELHLVLFQSLTVSYVTIKYSGGFERLSFIFVMSLLLTLNTFNSFI